MFFFHKSDGANTLDSRSNRLKIMFFFRKNFAGEFGKSTLKKASFKQNISPKTRLLSNLMN